MYLYPGADLLKIAMRIEMDGEKFYRQAMALAQDEKVRSFFHHLMEEEAKHYKTFDELQQKVSEKPAEDATTEEYQRYLQTFVERVLFPKEESETGQAHLQDVLSALRFAIHKELDSIHFYKEIKNFVPDRGQGEIDAIIAEERRHFMELIQMERRMK